MTANDIKVEMFSKILVKIDGKFIGSYMEFKGGRGMLISIERDETGEYKTHVAPFALYAQMNYDHSIMHRAIYIDLSGIKGAEFYIKDKELPDWLLPEFISDAA